MSDRDCLQRFLFETLPIRGEIVWLDATWRTVLERRAYPAAIRQVLGEAIAAAALLSATVKFDGLLTFANPGARTTAFAGGASRRRPYPARTGPLERRPGTGAAARPVRRRHTSS